MKNAIEIMKAAHFAGLVAGNDVIVKAMTVIGGGSEYFVADGVCGFASIHFKGNTKFGRAMKKSGLARSSYTGGLRMSVQAFNQSLQRKEAYAQAFVNVLKNNGITDAYFESRMD